MLLGKSGLGKSSFIETYINKVFILKKITNPNLSVNINGEFKETISIFFELVKRKEEKLEIIVKFIDSQGYSVFSDTWMNSVYHYIDSKVIKIKLVQSVQEIQKDSKDKHRKYSGNRRSKSI